MFILLFFDIFNHNKIDSVFGISSSAKSNMNLLSVRTGESVTSGPTLLNNLKLLRDWIESNSFLPKGLENEFLTSFQTWCDNEEEMQKMILKYFILRQNNWKVFRDRHPGCYIFDKFSSVSVVATSEVDFQIIIYSWLRNSDWKKFNIYQQVKVMLEELDIVLQESGLANKSVTIVQDMEFFTRDHLASITTYSANAVTELFRLMPVTLGVVLIVNPPEFVSEYTMLFSPLDFHIVEYVQDLAGFLPKQSLPSDLGGEPDAPNREEMWDAFMRRLGHYGPRLAFEEMVRDEEQYVRYSLPDPAPAESGKKKKKKEKKNDKKVKKNRK